MSRRYSKTEDTDAATLLGDDEYQPCAKCRNEFAHMSYHSSGPKCSAFQTNFNGEHLHMTCTRCGYQWAEKPADSAATWVDRGETIRDSI